VEKGCAEVSGRVAAVETGFEEAGLAFKASRRQDEQHMSSQLAEISDRVAAVERASRPSSQLAEVSDRVAAVEKELALEVEARKRDVEQLHADVFVEARDFAAKLGNPLEVEQVHVRLNELGSLVEAGTHTLRQEVLHLEGALHHQAAELHRLEELALGQQPPQQAASGQHGEALRQDLSNLRANVSEKWVKYEGRLLQLGQHVQQTEAQMLALRRLMDAAPQEDLKGLARDQAALTSGVARLAQAIGFLEERDVQAHSDEEWAELARSLAYRVEKAWIEQGSKLGGHHCLLDLVGAQKVGDHTSTQSLRLELESLRHEMNSRKEPNDRARSGSPHPAAGPSPGSPFAAAGAVAAAATEKLLASFEAPENGHGGSTPVSSTSVRNPYSLPLSPLSPAAAARPLSAHLSSRRDGESRWFDVSLRH